MILFDPILQYFKIAQKKKRSERPSLKPRWKGSSGPLDDVTQSTICQFCLGLLCSIPKRGVRDWILEGYMASATAFLGRRARIKSILMSCLTIYIAV